jgi:AcrR family transcriptional regulator
MKSRKEQIIQKAIHLYALEGYEGLSMRTLAEQVGISPSVLYHYFKDKDILLKEIFEATNTNLGIARAKLPVPTTAKDMLRQRIIFQLDHAEEIVFILKHFLSMRRFLPKVKEGFVPDKASLHIEEVLHYGKETGEFYVKDVASDAKVITHAINGFVLEYYPAKLSGKEKSVLVESIHNFLLRALMKGGEKYA